VVAPARLLILSGFLRMRPIAAGETLVEAFGRASGESSFGHVS
jgi:hypothetical protein